MSGSRSKNTRANDYRSDLPSVDLRDRTPRSRAFEENYHNNRLRYDTPHDAFYDDSASGDSPNELTLRDVIDFVRRNFRLVIAVATCVMVAMALYLVFKTPIYSSVATLEVGSYAPILPGDNSVEDAFTKQTRSQDYLNTLNAQILSPSLAKATLAVPEIKEQLQKEENRLSELPLARFTTWVKSLLSFAQFSSESNLSGDSGMSAADQLAFAEAEEIKSFLGMVSVKNVSKTSLISIEARSTSPILSSAIANTLADKFIDRVSGRRRKTTINKLEFLRGQNVEFENKIKEVEKKLTDYAEAHAIVNLGKEENVILKQFEELNQVLTEATAKRLRSKGALQEAKKSRGVQSGGIDDGSLDDIKTSLKQAEAEYSALSVKYSNEYPRMKELSAKIRSLKGQIVSALDAQYGLDMETEQSINNQLEKVRNDVFKMSKDQVQYNTLQDEYNSLKNLRHAVLAQIEQARLGAENEESNVSLSEPAITPLYPSSPKRGLLLIASIFLAPLAGILVALLKENLNRSFNSSEEAENFLAASALGVIPDFEKLTYSSAKQSAESGECISTRIVTDSQHEQQLAVYRETENVDNSLLESRYAAEEAFKLLRANILLWDAESQPKVIAITSAVKGEGKTTVAANLAVALSQVSGKCVVVESDLRQPSLCSVFGIDHKGPGLGDYLLGEVRLDDILISTQNENLFVVPAGKKTRNTSDLVTSERMKKIVHDLSERFAFVVLDTPPLLAVSDAVTLSRLADAALMVVRAKHTNREMVKAARVRLQRVGCNLLGVIINRTTKGSTDSYHSYYGNYVYVQEGG